MFRKKLSPLHVGPVHVDNTTGYYTLAAVILFSATLKEKITNLELEGKKTIFWSVSSPLQGMEVNTTTYILGFLGCWKSLVVFQYFEYIQHARIHSK